MRPRFKSTLRSHWRLRRIIQSSDQFVKAKPTHIKLSAAASMLRKDIKKPPEGGFWQGRLGLQLLRLHEAVKLSFGKAEPQVRISAELAVVGVDLGPLWVLG
jgi:hypothetical protein